MGVYVIDCTSCNKPFKWFSGHPDSQQCSDCEEKTRTRVRDNFAKNFVELIEHGQSHNVFFNITQYIFDGLTPEQMREINNKVAQALDEFDA